jgi:hypothetical protein
MVTQPPLSGKLLPTSFSIKFSAVKNYLRQETRIRRNGNYPLTEWNSLTMREPIDPVAVMASLRSALEQADAFIARMPTEKAGLLFLDGAKIVQPDPDRLDKYQTFAGQRRGHWPTNPEITAAMFERVACVS